MRITFVLPNPIRIPMGGAKVVYIHARNLAARGHEVEVVAPRQSGRGPLAMARRAAAGARDLLHGVAGETEYSAAGVVSRTILHPRPDAFSDADVVIATGVQTAPWVAALPASKGAQVYFVQGDETFVRPDARDSWHLGMQLVTCATWLKEEMQAVGLAPLAVVPNAVDLNEFGLDRPISPRDAHILGLYHRHPVKGPDVLIEALSEIRRQRPDVHASIFAARRPTHRIPPWVQVHVRPEPLALRALYNSASVLLHPSRSESMPLVPMEATACGASIAASLNPGVQEYLSAGVSMEGAPVGDARGLGEAALRLLTDEAMRVDRVTQARASVCATDWMKSSLRFESALRSAVLL